MNATAFANCPNCKTAKTAARKACEKQGWNSTQEVFRQRVENATCKQHTR